MQLYLNFDHILKEKELAKFKEYILKRVEHVPIQYILGEAHFRNLKLYVDENVLIPRPETELLVDKALESLTFYVNEIQNNNLGIDCINILEIGTGSGAIPISLAKEISIRDEIGWQIISTEKSAGALEVAKKNARTLLDEEQLKRIEFINADVLPASSDDSPLRKSSINMVVSNPPYISSEDYERLPREVKDFEPYESLHAGRQGLEVYEKILKSILPYINERLFILLFETDPGTISPLKELISGGLKTPSLDLKEITIEKDYNQRDRIVKVIMAEKS
jgi:release factor glutamine methyltransferase